MSKEPYFRGGVGEETWSSSEGTRSRETSRNSFKGNSIERSSEIISGTGSTGMEQDNVKICVGKRLEGLVNFYNNSLGNVQIIIEDFSCKGWSEDAMGRLLIDKLTLAAIELKVEDFVISVEGGTVRIPRLAEYEEYKRAHIAEVEDLVAASAASFKSREELLI